MLKQVSLVFLTKKSGDKKEILLAMKKRGFGLGKWNGVGGKMNDGIDKTIEEAAKREAKEEIGVSILTMKKVAVLDFLFSEPAKEQSQNQQVHVYFCDQWSGEPTESEEMAPKWFPSNELPYNKMWSPDSFWLPRILAGEKIKARFVFGKNQEVAEEEVEPAFF